MAWTDLQGQELVARLLQADVAARHVAPAYLFVGPPGVGKRDAALELARALNCAALHDNGSCGACDACRRIIRGTHPDVHQLDPQGAAANIRIEQVRHVLERMSLRPFMARAQVAVIAGAECLTEEAGNLLLKSLEEAPASSLFILLTAQPSACLPTIVSRCKPIRFKRPALQLPRPEGKEAQAMAALLGSSRREAWLEWTMPTNRDELSQSLSCAIVWLRDIALSRVADDAPLANQDHAAVIQRQAKQADPDRCVEAGLKMITLWHSLDEQMVSSRLIGTLVKEAWLNLTGRGARGAGHG